MKCCSVAQIIIHLCEAEVLPAQGKRVGEMCRQIGDSEQSHYGWRREDGGLKLDRAQRQKAFAQEDARL